MDLYFRIRENGASVFRLEAENRNRRLELVPLAQISLRSGEIRPQGKQVLSAQERAEIASWIETRRDQVERRDAEKLQQLIEMLNEAAHWIQGRAPDAAVAEQSDAVLMAMHDLRAAIVRRKADALNAGGG